MAMPCISDGQSDKKSFIKLKTNADFEHKCNKFNSNSTDSSTISLSVGIKDVTISNQFFISLTDRQNLMLKPQFVKKMMIQVSLSAFKHCIVLSSQKQC